MPYVVGGFEPTAFDSGGFYTGWEPDRTADVAVQVRADDVVVQVRADDVVIQVRADDVTVGVNQ